MASVPFFKTTITGHEGKYVSELLRTADNIERKYFTARCEEWFAQNHGIKNFFLTKSCTHSLELAALVLNIQPGDEVIMPSFAFVSCANAFALRGAKCVFVNVHPGTMNIDENDIEAAITAKTKAIVTVNYASVACNYPFIKQIAAKYGLYVVEDNAHGIGAKQNDTFLGTFGDISTFSFDHLKNVTCIQGGGIGINNEQLLERFYVAYEFGTNRRAFFKGNTDRYEWTGLGSNFPLSELNAAVLYSQLELVEDINSRFVAACEKYRVGLHDLSFGGAIKLPVLPNGCHYNGHCFYIVVADKKQRDKLVAYLTENGANAQFHYTELHESSLGKDIGRTATNVTCIGATLLRLPVFYSITETQIQSVTESLYRFFNQ